MARRASKTPGASTEGELNLVPIMNLVVCLIPIVLLGASLVKVGVINVNTPRFGPLPTPCDGGCEAPLNLSVTIDPDGFALRASGADLATLMAEADLPPARVQPDATTPDRVLITRAADALDLAALYSALAAIKKAHPTETMMTVSAAPGTPWREVVATMDIARTRLEADTYATAEALATAAVRSGSPSERLLWPDVVLTVAQ